MGIEGRVRAVFIGGCGRSGTTMLGSMLGANSDCIVTPESQFKIPCISSISRGSAEAVRWQAVEDLFRHPRLQLWDLELDRAEATRQAEDAQALLYWMVGEYARSRGKPEATVWIDHTGSNCRYSPRLLGHFPDARFIHLVRDGRAVAASVIPLDWGPNSVQRSAHWWTELVCHGLAGEDYLKERVIRVRFEEIVTSPEGTLRRVCDFLDISFEPKMLLANGFEVPAFTRNQHQLVGEAPDPSRAERWRSHLTPREVEIFENITGDLLVTLGYDLEYGTEIAPVRWRERFHAYGVEAVRGLVTNRIRHRRRLHGSIVGTRRDIGAGTNLAVSDSHAVL